MMDLRLALRGLFRRPAFTLLAVVTLTIGIGGNTTVFGLIDALLLRPLPLIREPERLVELSRGIGNNYVDMSYGVFQAMRAERQLLADAAAYTPAPVSLSIGDDAAVSVRTALSVTGNYFDVLGVRPGIGRFFAPGESFYPLVTPTVVISHRLWRERFASDPRIVGRTVRVNGVSLTSAWRARRHPDGGHGRAAHRGRLVHTRARRARCPRPRVESWVRMSRPSTSS